MMRYMLLLDNINIARCSELKRAIELAREFSWNDRKITVFDTLNHL